VSSKLSAADRIIKSNWKNSEGHWMYRAEEIYALAHQCGLADITVEDPGVKEIAQLLYLWSRNDRQR